MTRGLMLAGLMVGLAVCLGLAGPGPAAAGEIKIALDTPPNLEVSGTYVWVKAFDDYITQQGLKTKIYPRDALGGEEERLDQVCQGLLEVSCSDVAKAGQLDPAVFGFYLPFMFGDMAHLDRVAAQTDIIKNINIKLGQKGARLLAIVPLGSFVGFINNKKTIKTPEDLKGLRFRALDSKQALWLETWGANAVVIPWPEIYNSLQTGVVDGYLNVPIVPIMFKHTEVISHFSEAQLCAPLRVILASAEWYDGLSDKDRRIVDEAVKLGDQANRAWQKGIEAKAKAALIKAGVEIYENTPEERAKFAEMIKPRYNEMLDPAIVKVFVEASAKYK